MLRSLTDFLQDLVGGQAARGFEVNDYRVAAAALLLHASAVDGRVDAAESGKIHDLVRDRFGLDERSVANLLGTAGHRERESVDLTDFTSILKRALDEAGRSRVVAMLWEVCAADGKVDELEDNLISRVADLLGMSAHERMKLGAQFTGTGREADEFAS